MVLNGAMPASFIAPFSTISYQKSLPRKVDARRSGTTPPPTALSPWHTLQNRPNSAPPAATVSAGALSAGGLMTSWRGSSAGRVAVPPTLNTSTRLTLRRFPDEAATLPACSENADPQPDSTAMYCSPLTSYVIGPAMMADCATIDHSFSPVSAR